MSDPSKLDTLLLELVYGRAVPSMPDGEPELQQVNPMETKIAILALVKGCVSEEQQLRDSDLGAIVNAVIDGQIKGINQCRTETLKNLEML